MSLLIGFTLRSAEENNQQTNKRMHLRLFTSFVLRRPTGACAKKKGTKDAVGEVREIDVYSIPISTGDHYFGGYRRMKSCCPASSPSFKVSTHCCAFVVNFMAVLQGHALKFIQLKVLKGAFNEHFFWFGF